MPEKGVRPFFQPVGGGEIVDVVDIEIVMGLGITGKPQIQTGDVVDPPMHIAGLPVPLEPVKRILKIVLEDGAVKGLPQLVPHGAKAGVLLIQQRLHRLGRVAQAGKSGDVPVGGVDIKKFRLEAEQLLRGEHGVLPVLAVFRHVKHRPDAVIQQEELQDLPDVVGGGPAQDRNALLDQIRFGQELPADRPALAGDRLAVKRVFQ